MKRYKSFICIVLALGLMLSLTACKMGKDDDNLISDHDGSTVVKYKDGEYKASENKYDDQGYKPFVEIVIKDGRLYSVNCDDEFQDDGTKKAHSESGKYNMKAGGSQYQWHEEITLFEKYVVENGLEKINLNGEGKTDTIAGCTIAVDQYVKLIKEALEKAKK